MFNNTVNLRIKLAYLLISEGSCDPEAWSNGCWKFSFASEFVHWLVVGLATSWATQCVCRPVTFAIEVDFLLFHIYVIHTLMLRLCRLTHSGSCGLILKNELSFGPRADSAPEAFHPPQHCTTFVALRAICGPQYDGPVTLNTTIIKGNHSVA